MSLTEKANSIRIGWGRSLRAFGFDSCLMIIEGILFLVFLGGLSAGNGNVAVLSFLGMGVVALVGLIILLIQWSVTEPRHKGRRSQARVWKLGIVNLAFSIILLLGVYCTLWSTVSDKDDVVSYLMTSGFLAFYALVQIAGVLLMYVREKEGRYAEDNQLALEDGMRAVIQTLALVLGTAARGILGPSDFVNEMFFSVLFVERLFYVCEPFAKRFVRWFLKRGDSASKAAVKQE